MRYMVLINTLFLYGLYLFFISIALHTHQNRKGTSQEVTVLNSILRFVNFTRFVFYVVMWPGGPVWKLISFGCRVKNLDTCQFSYIYNNLQAIFNPICCLGFIVCLISVAMQLTESDINCLTYHVNYIDVAFMAKANLHIFEPLVFQT
jgi:hypothetical protein